jgi:hypothetical protein
MGTESKTAKAVRTAEEKSRAKAVVARTPEQRLADIGKNLAAGLFVTPEDVRLLYSEYLKVSARAKTIEENLC